MTSRARDRVDSPFKASDTHRARSPPLGLPPTSGSTSVPWRRASSSSLPLVGTRRTSLRDSLPEASHMPAIASSDDLRDLAEARLDEARALLAQQHYSGAFYLAGYVVELGLKAVLTKELRGHALPDKRDVERAHTHDLTALAKSAGLAPETSPVRVHWNTVTSSWGPADRYRQHAQAPAQQLVEAAEEVLKWLKLHW
jgi:HEPN domain-containing protein